MSHAYDSLAHQLRDGNLIAFLGAGVSRTYNEAASNRTWPGLPTASEIVSRIASKYGYISAELTFQQACFLFRQREGRGALEKLLLEELDRPVIQPLPAHVILANLPFPAYITVNYDQLLERALSDAKRRPQPIVVDDDVCRLKPNQVPIIKLHGCVSRPETIIAAEDDYSYIPTQSPIVASLLRTMLANKSLLFLGFSLADPDFKLVFEELRSMLKDRMPKSYAVARTPSAYEKDYWKSKGVELIESDLTDSLRQLMRTSAGLQAPVIYTPNDDAFNNVFFESLHKIRTLPSETQVLDAFIAHLLSEIRGGNYPIEDILDRAQKAASSVLARRPHFQALKAVSETLIVSIRSTCTTVDEAEDVLRSYSEERHDVSTKLSANAKRLVKRGNSLLLYSQSMRVLDLLISVPRGIQASCHLFVAECRPKSPAPFQDALSICESLRDTAYEVTIIPDAAIGNLIGRKQISRVLMGSHEIYLRDTTPISFVNTCGSLLIIDAAVESGVPVSIIAESSKIIRLAPEDEAPSASFEVEEELFSSISNTLSDLKASGQKLNVLNLGYDLCSFSNGISLTTEVSLGSDPLETGNDSN